MDDEVYYSKLIKHLKNSINTMNRKATGTHTSDHQQANEQCQPQGGEVIGDGLLQKNIEQSDAPQCSAINFASVRRQTNPEIQCCEEKCCNHDIIFFKPKTKNESEFNLASDCRKNYENQKYAMVEPTINPFCWPYNHYVTFTKPKTETESECRDFGVSQWNHATRCYHQKYANVEPIIKPCNCSGFSTKRNTETESGFNDASVCRGNHETHFYHQNFANVEPIMKPCNCTGIATNRNAETESGSNDASACRGNPETQCYHQNFAYVEPIMTPCYRPYNNSDSTKPNTETEPEFNDASVYRSNRAEQFFHQNYAKVGPAMKSYCRPCSRSVISTKPNPETETEFNDCSIPQRNQAVQCYHEMCAMIGPAMKPCNHCVISIKNTETASEFNGEISRATHKNRYYRQRKAKETAKMQRCNLPNNEVVSSEPTLETELHEPSDSCTLTPNQKVIPVTPKTESDLKYIYRNVNPITSSERSSLSLISARKLRKMVRRSQCKEYKLQNEVNAKNKDHVNCLENKNHIKETDDNKSVQSLSPKESNEVADVEVLVCTKLLRPIKKRIREGFLKNLVDDFNLVDELNRVSHKVCTIFGTPKAELIAPIERGDGDAKPYRN